MTSLPPTQMFLYQEDQQEQPTASPTRTINISQLKKITGTKSSIRAIFSFVDHLIGTIKIV